MITPWFIAGTLIIIILYDIVAYLIGLDRGVGTKYTISVKIYQLAHSPVIGPIITFLTGALIYHLFICQSGCG